MYTDELRKRPPMSEARLKLRIADLLVTAVALGTRATPADKGHRYTVADLPPGDVPANFRHDAGKLMPGNMRQLDVRIMPLPAVPVAAADAGAPHLYDHAVTLRRRVFDVHQARRLGKGFVDNCFHESHLCSDRHDVVFVRFLARGGSNQR